MDTRPIRLRFPVATIFSARPIAPVMNPCTSPSQLGGNLSRTFRSLPLFPHCAFHSELTYILTYQGVGTPDGEDLQALLASHDAQRW